MLTMTILPNAAPQKQNKDDNPMSITSKRQKQKTNNDSNGCGC